LAVRGARAETGPLASAFEAAYRTLAIEAPGVSPQDFVCAVRNAVES
jgi:hypothetical protein